MGLLRSLLSHLSTSRSRSRSSSSRQGRRRPQLEGLEDRLAPVVGVFDFPVEAPSFTGVVALDRSGDLHDGRNGGNGSGSLLWTGRHILTAAHVVAGGEGGTIDIDDITVVFQTGGREIEMTVPASSFLVHPGWNGDPNNGNDLAILTLPAVAPIDAQRLAIHRNTDEVGRWFYVVGYGITGTVDSALSYDGVRRVGTNVFDRWDTENFTLRWDLDGDTDEWAFNANLTGVSSELDEVGILGGDSGGPSLVWGRTGQLEIAAVTSFIAGQFLDNPRTPGTGDEYASAQVSVEQEWIDRMVRDTHELVVDLRYLEAGNNGSADTLRLEAANGDALVYLNDRLLHRGRLERITSIHLIGSEDADHFIVATQGLQVPVRVTGVNRPDVTRDDLQVLGTEGADQVVLSAGRVAVSATAPVPTSTTVDYTGLQALTVRTGNLGDTVRIDAVESPASPSLAVTVETGGGIDTIDVGGLGRRLDVLPDRGPGSFGFEGIVRLHLDGQADPDYITFNDQNGPVAGARYTVNPAVGRNNVALLEVPGAGSATYTGFETVTLNTTAGRDTINLHYTLPGSNTVLNAGGEDDTIRLGGAYFRNALDFGNSSLASMGGSITVNGGAQRGTGDRLIVEDAVVEGPMPGPARPNVYTIDAGTLTHREPALTDRVRTVTYSNLESVELIGGSSTNEYSVIRTTAGAPLTIQGGSSSDVVTIGGEYVESSRFPRLPSLPIGTTLATLAASVTFNGGQGGADRLVLNDRTNFGLTATATNQYTLDAGRVTQRQTQTNRFGTSTSPPTSRVYEQNVTYTGLTSVEVNSGGWNDTFNVRSNALGPRRTINAGTGDDTLIGPDTASIFQLTGTDAGTLADPAADARLLNGVTTFTGVENLTGGSSPDRFAFSSGARLTGRLDGGPTPALGNNTLDYSGFAADAPVVVTLEAGVATAVGRGIGNIVSVVGGAGNDLLVGNNANNSLYGNAGRDVIVGRGGTYLNATDPGGDMLDGGAGEDILIGGATRYDLEADLFTLRGIRNVWGTLQDPNLPQRPALADYRNRVESVLRLPTPMFPEGSGLESGFVPNDRQNYLTGGTDALDLFFGSPGDHLRSDWDRSRGERFYPQVEGITRLDASGFGARALRVDGQAYNPIVPIELAPGAHTVQIDHGAVIDFRVAADGAFHFNPDLEGAFTGWGTRNLTIQGHRLTFDASALGWQHLYIDSVPIAGATGPVTRNLLPGTHSVFSHSSWGAVYWFTVADNGAITSTTSPAGVIAIDPANPSRLVLQGRAVTFNAVDRPDVRTLWIDSAPFAIGESRSRTLNLLPGRHSFFTAHSEVYEFTVGDDGAITAIAAPAGVATGEGATLRLTAPSLTVSISSQLGHASQPALGTVYIDGLGYDASTPLNLRFVPGRHALRGREGEVLYFSVNPEGTVSYEAGLEGVLSGAGTAQLNVHGRAVRLDAAALGLRYLYVDGAPISDARGEVVVHLMPGSHSLFSHNAYGNIYRFTLERNGSISSTTAPAGIIGITIDAFGTAGLTLRGLAVTFDTSLRPDLRAVWIDGVGYSLDPARALTLNLLPGRHLLWTADNVQRSFTVSEEGDITFENDPGGILVRTA